MSSTSTTLCDKSLFPYLNRRERPVHTRSLLAQRRSVRTLYINISIITCAPEPDLSHLTTPRARGGGGTAGGVAGPVVEVPAAHALRSHARTRGSSDTKARVRLRSWRSCCGRSCCRASSRCASCLRKRDDVGSRGITREHASRGRGMGCYGHEAARGGTPRFRASLLTLHGRALRQGHDGAHRVADLHANAARVGGFVPHGEDVLLVANREDAAADLVAHAELAAEDGQ